MQGDIAYLIKEQGSAIGLLKLSRMIGMGIGESSLYMTEQLTLKQGLCYGTGIDSNHGLTVTEACRMYLTCQDM